VAALATEERTRTAAGVSVTPSLEHVQKQRYRTS
jgi:hypothetical protein